MPDTAELLSLYDAATDYFEGTYSEKTAVSAHILDLLGPPRADNRLLDVGAGTGLFVQAARRRGWQAEGVEPTARFAAAAADPSVRHGVLDESYNDGRFNVITLIGVLEHVSDPLSMLATARLAADDNAKLVVVVPNADRLDGILLDTLLRLSRRPWTVRTAPLQLPFHVCEFARRSILRACHETGWTPRSIRGLPGYNPYPLGRWSRGILRVVEHVGALVQMPTQLVLLADAC